MKILLTLFLFISVIAHAEDCAQFLDEGSSNATLISYFEALIDRGVPIDLEKFASSLEQGKLQNPLSAKSTELRIHAREIEHYLRDPNFNRGALLEWARSKIKHDQGTQVQRSAVQQKTIRREMKFVVTNMLPMYALEIMDTPVTQGMWVELMGENPSDHKLNGQTQPDHPVENLTWFAAAEFANRMSRRAGLKPYYDFDDLEPTGTAESGDFDFEAYDVELHKKRKTDPSLAEGYRLPTSEEMRILIQPAVDILKNANVDRDLYVWGHSNSGAQTHPVADLQPLPVPPVKIFDIFGNVAEFTNDWKDIGSAIITGGNFSSQDLLQVSYAHPDVPDWRIGFRLVRTRR